MSIAIVERLTKKIPLDENMKNDLSYSQEPSSLFGESTDNFIQMRDPSKSIKENTNFSANNLIEADLGYDLSGSYFKSNPENGGFNGLSGRGSMSNLYLYPEYSIKQDPLHKLTYREKHSYDYERLMKYDSKQLKDPRLKECKNKENFKMNSKEISVQTLKSHINGYKGINKGPHGPYYKKSFDDYIPNLKKNTDEKPMESSYEHYVQVGDTSRYGRHGPETGNDYISKINRRGRDDKVSPNVLKVNLGTHTLYGDGRYSGFSGFSKK